jgi:hypothetical protein
MRCSRFLLALLVPAAFALPAPAGILFGKHSKPNPVERVPQLITAAKSETDDDKRGDAIRELREYEPAKFPEIVPVLVDALLHDPKSSVRSEAAQSLSKLRPISQEAGAALEEAAHDSSFRVRMQARSALLGYRLAGYHSAPKPEEKAAMKSDKNPPVVKTIPPVPDTKPVAVTPPIVVTLPAKRSGKFIAPAETPPPPLASPEPEKTAVQAPPKAPVSKPQPPPAQPDSGPDLPPQ